MEGVFHPCDVSWPLFFSPCTRVCVCGGASLFLSADDDSCKDSLSRDERSKTKQYKRKKRGSVSGERENACVRVSLSHTLPVSFFLYRKEIARSAPLITECVRCETCKVLLCFLARSETYIESCCLSKIPCNCRGTHLDVLLLNAREKKKRQNLCVLLLHSLFSFRPFFFFTFVDRVCLCMYFHSFRYFCLHVTRQPNLRDALRAATRAPSRRCPREPPLPPLRRPAPQPPQPLWKVLCTRSRPTGSITCSAPSHVLLRSSGRSCAVVSLRRLCRHCPSHSLLHLA